MYKETNACLELRLKLEDGKPLHEWVDFTRKTYFQSPLSQNFHAHRTHRFSRMQKSVQKFIYLNFISSTKRGREEERREKDWKNHLYSHTSKITIIIVLIVENSAFAIEKNERTTRKQSVTVINLSKYYDQPNCIYTFTECLYVYCWNAEEMSANELIDSFGTLFTAGCWNKRNSS